MRKQRFICLVSAAAAVLTLAWNASAQCHDLFVFTDGTGDVQVQIPRELLQGRGLDEGSMILIHGRIAQDFRSTPRIDVAQLEILAR